MARPFDTSRRHLPCPSDNFLIHSSNIFAKISGYISLPPGRHASVGKTTIPGRRLTHRSTNSCSHPYDACPRYQPNTDIGVPAAPPSTRPTLPSSVGAGIQVRERDEEIRRGRKKKLSHRSFPPRSPSPRRPLIGTLLALFS